MRLTTFLLPFLLLVPFCFTISAVADERKVTPSIALQQEYNDNLFFSSQARERDFITTVSPALELINNTERLQAGLKMKLDSSYYYDNSNLNNIDQDYSGSLRYAVSPTANLFTSAGYRQDSRVDRDFTQTGLLQGAVTRDRYSYRVGGDSALSEVMGVQLQYSFDSDYYAGSAFSDYKAHELSFLLSRDFSRFISRTIGQLNLGMARFDTQGSQVTNYSGTIGAERSWDERFSLFIDLGLRHTQSTFEAIQLVPTVNPFVFLAVPYEEQAEGTGLSGQAGMSYKGELHNARLVLSHGVTAASGRSGTVERTAVLGNIGRRLNETSVVSFAAGYVVNKSTQDGLAAGAIDERAVWLIPKMLYSLTDQLAVEGSYHYALVNDRQAETEAERNLILLRLVYQYKLIE